MKILEEQVFIGEIAMQALIAKRAAKRLEGDLDQPDLIDTWGAIQSILISAANISKILWPGEKNRTRGDALRRLLEVSDDSPLADRTFRNHFEHYDERVEDWFKNSGSAVYIDPVIDSFGSSFRAKYTVRHRVYDPMKRVLIFREEQTDLGKYIDAIDVILRKCSYLTPLVNAFDQ